MVREISAEELNPRKDTFVVKVTATWCGACKAIHPEYARLASQYSNVGFAEIDADKNMEFVSNELGVKSLPTFLFYGGGQLVNKVVGNKPAELRKGVDELSNSY